MRVRQFELRLIAAALVAAWSVAALLVLIAYRPGGPLDIVVGASLLLPISIAAAGFLWPPVARGRFAFPIVVALGVGALLLLLPSIGGVYKQLEALGSQTLLPSLQAAYPWALALLGTSLFAGFGIARRLLGPGARPRRLLIGIVAGTILTVVAGGLFAGLAVANDVALRDGSVAARGSRFGPTDLTHDPPACDGPLLPGAGARIATDMDASVDLRPIGSVEQRGLRTGRDFRWLAFVAGDLALGQFGKATIGGRAWIRTPDSRWNTATLESVADGTVDLLVLETALTGGFRTTAEDRGIEVIERAPARRCRVAVDGETFSAAFPQVRWLLGDADVAHWRGQLDYWVFLDGELGQVAGNLNGEGSVVDETALQGNVEVLLTATERDRDFVIYPPAR